VLPNAAIPDDKPLTSFIVPGQSCSLNLLRARLTCTFAVEDVEKVAGITLFSDAIKRSSKHICQTSVCEVVVRRFDEAQKGVKRIPAPKH
jgi:endonuclease G